MRLLALWYLLDRCWRWLVLRRFFAKPKPAAPDVWPSIDLIQPLTRGVFDLATTLEQRLNLRYSGQLNHYWVVDRADQETFAVCSALQRKNPNHAITIVQIEPDWGRFASKLGKMRAALAQAQAAVVWFVDDDITLPPDGLSQAIPYLLQPQVGAIFGLACYTNWQNLPSALMSNFVNANALPSYVGVAALTEPYTITGHQFALQRSVFEHIGGFEAMDGRIDDDHELARRVQAHGLRNLQTPLIYTVDNYFATLKAYGLQMERWFTIPRVLMLPELTRRDRLVTGLTSAAQPIPPLLALASLPSPKLRPWLVACLAAQLSLHVWQMRRYCQQATPWWAWPLSIVGSLLDPLLMLWGLLGDDTIVWRGERIRLRHLAAAQWLGKEQNHD
ncbi:glycosyltransferase [Herpetosiphon llansteffanensis]|uniref:glycosyltransferase n=1 Tax=Herpetosiphon llansteffanensis TaxID=2094568 RepID=UPI000D7CC79A|nr:glycosyltransferase [Herpetosiphon llansteffanensis]